MCSGYTTEVAAFLELALSGSQIGSNDTNASAGSGVVYINGSIWSSVLPTVSCIAPCTLVLPPYSLGSTTTITFPPFTTTLEVAWITTVTTSISGTAHTITSLTSISESTVLTPTPRKCIQDVTSLPLLTFRSYDDSNTFLERERNWNHPYDYLAHREPASITIYHYRQPKPAVTVRSVTFSSTSNYYTPSLSLHPDVINKKFGFAYIDEV